MRVLGQLKDWSLTIGSLKYKSGAPYLRNKATEWGFKMLVGTKCNMHVKDTFAMGKDIYMFHY